MKSVRIILSDHVVSKWHLQLITVLIGRVFVWWRFNECLWTVHDFQLQWYVTAAWFIHASSFCDFYCLRGSWNFARTCTLTTSRSLLNLNVKGQGHMSFCGVFFCLHNATPTRGQYLALSKAWWSCYFWTRTWLTWQIRDPTALSKFLVQCSIRWLHIVACVIVNLWQRLSETCVSAIITVQLSVASFVLPTHDVQLPTHLLLWHRLHDSAQLLCLSIEYCTYTYSTSPEKKVLVFSRITLTNLNVFFRGFFKEILELHKWGAWGRKSPSMVQGRSPSRGSGV